MATDLSTEALYPDGSAGGAKSELPVRYHALDRVRATAMLLGVVYHAMMFRMFVGAGGGPGPFGGADSSHWFSEWLHSFRMPLFFLISGFFGRMMLEKYGMSKYLKRRWQRIAVPLFIGLFTFSPLYIVTRDLVAGGGFGPGGGPPRGAMPGPFGPPPPGDRSGGSFERGPGGPMPGMSGPPTAGATEPGSFGPPPGGGPGPGSFGPPPGGGPGPGSFGPPPGGGPGPGSFGPPPGGGPGPGSFGPPPGGGPGPGGFGARETRLSDRLFGRYSHYFDLHHLWFLWYLLVFVTFAPWLVKGLGWLLPRSWEQPADQVSQWLARWGLAPLLFGLIATPTLMMTSSPFGWSLGLAPAIFRGFPDFLLHLDPDMAVYFVYFLWGWWLHRQRVALPAVGRAWLPSLLIGFASLAASAALSEAYSRRFDAPDYSLIRAGGSLLYCLGSAWTAWAFLGVFIRYLDRPSRTWRYLADTALWVYLIHQPLVILGLALFKPLHLPWWAQTAAVSALSACAALLLYEAIIRPTPLVRLFGPASPGRASVNAECGMRNGEFGMRNEE